jgi:hypothetical protein
MAATPCGNRGPPAGPTQYISQRGQPEMSVRHDATDEQREPPGGPLISLRALVLFTLTLAAGGLVFLHPALGVPLGVGVAVLGILRSTVGR